MANDLLYTQLMERVMVERPELAPYVELFQQATNNNENDASDSRVQELEAKLRKLSAITKRLKQDLDYALDDLDNLAKALGACDACWGEDNRCPSCRGKGKSGFFQPEQELFDRLILPAVKEATRADVKQ
jgi:hypothetical protein